MVEQPVRNLREARRLRFEQEANAKAEMEAQSQQQVTQDQAMTELEKKLPGISNIKSETRYNRLLSTANTYGIGSRITYLEFERIKQEERLDYLRSLPKSERTAQEIKNTERTLRSRESSYSNAIRRYEGVPTQRAEKLAIEQGFSSAQERKATIQRERAAERGVIDLGQRYFFLEEKQKLFSTTGGLKKDELKAVQIPIEEYKRIETLQQEQKRENQYLSPGEFQQEIVSSLQGKQKALGYEIEPIRVIDTEDNRIGAYLISGEKREVLISPEITIEAPKGSILTRGFERQVGSQEISPTEKVIKTLAKTGKEVTYKGGIITALSKEKNEYEFVNLLRSGKEVLGKTYRDYRTIVNPAFFEINYRDVKSATQQAKEGAVYGYKFVTSVVSLPVQFLSGAGSGLLEKVGYGKKKQKEDFGKIKGKVETFQSEKIAPKLKDLTSPLNTTRILKEIKLSQARKEQGGFFTTSRRYILETEVAALNLIEAPFTYVREKPLEAGAIAVAGALSGPAVKYLVGTGAEAKVTTKILGAVFAGTVAVEATAAGIAQKDIQASVRVVGERGTQALIFTGGAYAGQKIEGLFKAPRVEVTKAKSTKVNIRQVETRDKSGLKKALTLTVESRKTTKITRTKVKGYDRIIKKLDIEGSKPLNINDRTRAIRKAGVVRLQVKKRSGFVDVNKVKLGGKKYLVVEGNRPVIKKSIPKVTRYYNVNPEPFLVEGVGRIAKIETYKKGKISFISRDLIIKKVINPTKLKIKTIEGKKVFSALEAASVDKKAKLPKGTNIIRDELQARQADITKVFKTRKDYISFGAVAGVGIPAPPIRITRLVATTAKYPVLSSRPIPEPSITVFPAYKLESEQEGKPEGKQKSFIRIGSRIDEGQRDIISPIDRLGRENLRKPTIDVESGGDIKIMSALSPSIKQREKPELENKITPKPKLAVDLKPALDIAPIVRQETTTRGPIDIEKERPDQPQLAIDLPKLQGQEDRKQFTGFDVFVKKEGFFKKVNIQPLTKKSALSLGAKEVDLTTAARFRITETKSTRKPLDIGEDYFGKTRGKFRAFNVSYKGQRQGNLIEGEFIEKRKYRIDSPLEVSGLQIARGSKGFL